MKPCFSLLILVLGCAEPLWKQSEAQSPSAAADSTFRTGSCRIRTPEAFRWEDVVERTDQPPRVIAATMPMFPMHLRTRGGDYSGRLVLAMVVDTLGRVEPATVSVEESTDPRLSNWGCLIALQLRFLPAKAAGHHVPALVEQAFSYSASRSP
jgi:hypothetical protein